MNIDVVDYESRPALDAELADCAFAAVAGWPDQRPIGPGLVELTALTWRGPWRERLRLARVQLRRPARTSPFGSTEEFRKAFAVFPEVEVSVDGAAPARALRLHPNFVRGTGSRCVRVLAVK